MVSGDDELKPAIQLQESESRRTTAECMAARVLETPSVLLMNEALAERETYARTLRAYGYQVVEAATSVAAYQIAITRRTDIVVTDVRLTGSMTGLELMRRLRTHARTTTVPVIVLTDVSRPQDAELALKAGANMVLERPVWADVLRQRIAPLLLGAAPRANRRRRLDSK